MYRALLPLVSKSKAHVLNQRKEVYHESNSCQPRGQEFFPETRKSLQKRTLLCGVQCYSIRYLSRVAVFFIFFRKVLENDENGPARGVLRTGLRLVLTLGLCL